MNNISEKILYINKLSLKHTASNETIESENNKNYPIIMSNNSIYDLFIIPEEFISKNFNYSIFTDYSLQNSKEIDVYIISFYSIVYLE